MSFQPLSGGEGSGELLWLLRGQRSVHQLGLNSATNTRSQRLQQRAAQSSSGSLAWAPTSGISFSWEPISGLTPDLLNQTLWRKFPEAHAFRSPPGDSEAHWSSGATGPSFVAGRPEWAAGAGTVVQPCH